MNANQMKEIANFIEPFRQMWDRLFNKLETVMKKYEPRVAGESIVVEFAPQLELLKCAALCITHAGLNTALECLSNGLPMVAIPITNDQPGVAARSEWMGTGEMVSGSS